MVNGLNAIIKAGTPIVQFNGLGVGVNAPYVGEKSVESGRLLGKMVLDKIGGKSAKGDVIVGNCYPGFPVLENRQKGVLESLKKAWQPLMECFKSSPKMSQKTLNSSSILKPVWLL